MLRVSLHPSFLRCFCPTHLRLPVGVEPPTQPAVTAVVAMYACGRPLEPSADGKHMCCKRHNMEGVLFGSSQKWCAAQGRIRLRCEHGKDAQKRKIIPVDHEVCLSRTERAQVGAIVVAAIACRVGVQTHIDRSRATNNAESPPWFNALPLTEPADVANACSVFRDAQNLLYEQLIALVSPLYVELERGLADKQPRPCAAPSAPSASSCPSASFATSASSGSSSTVSQPPYSSLPALRPPPVRLSFDAQMITMAPKGVEKKALQLLNRGDVMACIGKLSRKRKADRNSPRMALVRYNTGPVRIDYTEIDKSTDFVTDVASLLHWNHASRRAKVNCCGIKAVNTLYGRLFPVDPTCVKCVTVE
jgi:hypothetical protein